MMTPGRNPSAKRPLGLSVYLLLLLIGGTAAVTSALFDREPWLHEFENITPCLLNILIGCGILNIVSCCGMWMWRKWGFTLSLVNLMATAGIELYISPPFIHVARLPFAFGLLLYFYAPHRARFH